LDERENRVERAIEHTRRALQTMPSYRRTAVESLRRWRDRLAAQAPDDPALRKLDDFLAGLDDEAAP
jgi:hypothetical protein